MWPVYYLSHTVLWSHLPSCSLFSSHNVLLFCAYIKDSMYTCFISKNVLPKSLHIYMAPYHPSDSRSNIKPENPLPDQSIKHHPCPVPMCSIALFALFILFLAFMTYDNLKFSSSCVGSGNINSLRAKIQSLLPLCLLYSIFCLMHN